MASEEITTTEIKQSLDELTLFLQEHMLTKEEALGLFATKDEVVQFKNEILTAIDAIGVQHRTFDQELLMLRSQYLRHEDRLEVIEGKLQIKPT